jgi:putative nucleotidyltransferase with HDIG domain
VKIGFGAAVTYFLVSWGESILAHQQLDRMLTDFSLLRESLRGAAWCLAAGYLVAGSLPFIEQTFGMVTDISLLELSDVSHPLLQELVRRAPGTYNHSIGVATISETAADAIGANGLLCRVGAYFHDIGKMMKPQYFVENMTAGQDSRHEHLNPAMSTLVIIGHVKDGVDLAHRQGLPRPLIDFIEQHHGTTLVEYFFHAATRQAESDPEHHSRVEESSFRYPGPKPQTREAAVLMIADAVEGASRTLTEPTPKRIETLVHDIAMKRLLDGQFDECSLTLRELAIVEDSLTKSLIGIYHGRIKYPEQRTA